MRRRSPAAAGAPSLRGRVSGSQVSAQDALPVEKHRHPPHCEPVLEVSKALVSRSHILLVPLTEDDAAAAQALATRSAEGPCGPCLKARLTS